MFLFPLRVLSNADQIRENAVSAGNAGGQLTVKSKGVIDIDAAPVTGQKQAAFLGILINR
jgi:hypothetical protein